MACKYIKIKYPTSSNIINFKNIYSIHNLSTSSRHPINLSKFVQHVSNAWKQHGGGSAQVYNKKWMRKLIIAKQQIPQQIKHRIGSLMDIKSWKIQAQKNKVLINKKKQLLNRYEYFLEHQWICQSNKSIDIFTRMIPSDQLLFPFNVNTINWANYIKLCVYGTKKYLLGQHVQGFSSTRLDLLTLERSSYFSDIFWALTGGKNVEAQSLQQLKNYILSTKSVKQSIKNLVQGHASKLDKTPTSYQKLQEQYQTIAQQMCQQMFSQYQMKSIRMFAWFLHKTFKSIYQKVVIDQKALLKLKNHDQKLSGPLVLIPTHRSYIDFLIMSYVFFGYGIKCPHIAAAEDFLNMAIIHILLRRSGAFFIKRNQQKNKILYKAIMTEYISKLLIDSQYLQFFIQGTRSRVGKMLTPKYGILSIIAKNVIDGKIPDATILPVTINYQKVLEGNSFTYQLMGQPKVKQTLSRLIKAVDVLKQNYGRIYIQFCQTISIKQFYRTNHPKNFQENLQKLGYTIIYQLNNHLVVTAPALVATAILMQRKGISDDSLNTIISWLCKQIASRNIKIGRIQSDTSISLTNTLQLLGDIINKSKKDMFQVQLSFDQSSFSKLFRMIYYRNTLTHIFFEEAIIVVALTRFGHQNIIIDKITVEQLFAECIFVNSFLNEEYVLQHNISQPKRFNEVISFMKDKNIIKIQANKVVALEPNGTYFNLCCSLIWPIIETYWITSLYLLKLMKSQSMELNKLYTEIQWFAQSLITQRIVLHIQAMSLDTIKNAVMKFKLMKIIQITNQKTQNSDLNWVKVIINQQNVKKLSSRLKLFLKSSYAQSVMGILQSGGGSVTLDFPFLSKL